MTENGSDSLPFEPPGTGPDRHRRRERRRKSTLIGCLFASLFRQLPGQKRPLYDFATHPQPEIDVSFTVNGHRYRSVLKVNPQARQMESYLFSGDGTPLSDGKKESFQEAVQRLIGSRALYEASMFSNQKRVGNWYKEFVIRGAIEHRLPAKYIRHLQITDSMPDPNRERSARNKALMLKIRDSERLSGFPANH
jgi:DNA repair exonuclease SbcCD ATPase subunit